MKFKRYCLNTALALLAGSCSLASYALTNDEPPAIPLKQGDTYANFKAFEDFLTRNSSKVERKATGELAGIGDVQAISTLSPDVQVLILTQNADGQLRLSSFSKIKDSRYRDIGVTPKVDKGSLFLSLEAIKGVWGDYQFKAQPDGRLRLIGIKLHVATYTADPDEGEANHAGEGMVDTDFNLVTGKMLFKRKDDPRPLSAQVSGPACYLDEFNFDFFSCAESMKTTKGIAASDLMVPRG